MYNSILTGSWVPAERDVIYISTLKTDLGNASVENIMIKNAANIAAFLIR
jgi:hypothetical protein